MTDKINPPHYRQQPVECIDLTEHLTFTLGNAFKYVWRYRDKNGLEDLHKAAWYLQRHITAQPSVYWMDTETYVSGVNALGDCNFDERQRVILLKIWTAAHAPDGSELPAALQLINQLIQEAV